MLDQRGPMKNNQKNYIVVCGEQRPACLVRSHGEVTVAQSAENINDGDDRKLL